MDRFREELEACKLVNASYSRSWHTWERGNLPKTNIRKRLDRCMVKEVLMSFFSNLLVYRLPYSIQITALYLFI